MLGGPSARTVAAAKGAGQVKTSTDGFGNVAETQYDAAGRQEVITDGLDHETSFQYDSLGRVIRTTFDDGTFTRTEFDALGRRKAEIDQLGLRTEYGYDDAGRLTEVRLPAVSDDSTGSITGTPTYQYAYDAYGVMLVGAGLTTADDASTSLLYSGEWMDAETGLQYNRARWYDPATGRWNRLDPFAGNNLDPISLHKYLYANADPVQFVDPSGRFGLVGLLSGFSIANSIQTIKIEVDLAAFQAAESTVSGIGLQQQFLLLAGGTILGAAVGPLLDLGSSLLTRIADDVGEFITKTSTELVQLARRGQKAIAFSDLDLLGRPQFARAIITRETLLTGTGPISSIRPPGFLGDTAGHARGHLIAAQLGGAGNERRNIVTIFQNPANVPAMRQVENQVRRAVEVGETVDYLAIPIYEGSELVPRGITLVAKGDRGLDLGVTVLNRP